MSMQLTDKNAPFRLLIFGSFYSSFMEKLVQHLSVHRQVQADYLLVDQGYRAYCTGLKRIDFSLVYLSLREQRPSDSSLAKIEELHFLSLKNLTPSDLLYAAHFRDYLKNLIKANSYHTLIMHNDARWNHRIAIDLCLENNLNYLVTERGGLRPFTTTMDTRGVNANSSFPKVASFYQNYHLSSQAMAKREKMKSLKNYRAVGMSELVHFGHFLFWQTWGKITGRNAPIAHQAFSLRHYLQRALTLLKIKPSRPITKDLPSDAIYFYVPLQVEGDSQVKLHSRFQTMNEFLGFLTQGLELYKKEHHRLIYLVVKKHPMAPNTKLTQHPYVVVAKNHHVGLIENAAGVMTINSTVGFEAMKLKKHVAVAGNAFYGIEGLAEKLQTPQDVASFIEKSLTEAHVPNQELMNNFFDYYLYEYQVLGNMFRPLPETLKEVEDRFFSQQQ